MYHRGAGAKSVMDWDWITGWGEVHGAKKRDILGIIPIIPAAHFDELLCPFRKATKIWIAQAPTVRAIPEASKRKLPESCSGPIRLDLLSVHKLSSFFSHHLKLVISNVGITDRIWLLVFQLLQGASVGHFKQGPVDSFPQTNLSLIPGENIWCPDK